MKTLILYATKNGATAEVARRLAEQCGDADVHDLKQPGDPALTGYDRVIVGSPLYAGMIRKEAKEYLVAHASEIESITHGFFLCGLDARGETDNFALNFSEPLVRTARVTALLGGVFDPKKSGFADKLIIKAIMKLNAYTDKIDNAAIAQFAEEMSA